MYWKDNVIKGISYIPKLFSDKERKSLTRVVFEDFQIPYFGETKQFILKGVRLVPNIKLVGWDIAITKSVSVLIEGNYNYDITNNDLVYGGYKTNLVFKKVLQELNNIY